MKSLTKRMAAAGLALCLTLSLAPAVLAAGEDAPERGVLTYSEAIAPKYEDAGTFNNGLAPVKQNGKWGYIDTDGKTVIPFQYDIAGLFSEGFALVGNEVEMDPYYDPDEPLSAYELGFVDTKGNYTPFICPDQYDWKTDDYVTGPIQYVTGDSMLSNDMVFHNGHITLSRPDEPTNYLYDTTGSIVELPLPEDDWWSYSLGWQLTENILIVGDWVIEGGDQKYLDLTTGKIIQIGGSKYEEYCLPDLRPFNQGLAMVKMRQWNDDTQQYEGLWGAINTKGQFVIEPAYTNFRVNDIYGAYEVFGVTGLAMVENTAGKWGAIDKSGKTVIPFNYEHLYTYSFGLLAFQQNGKWGYLDEDLNVVIPAQYAETTGFNGSGYAVAYDGSKAFLIDSKGNAIPGADKLDPSTYFMGEGDNKTIVTPSEYVVIQENGKYGYGHIEYLPPLPAESDMSGWAYAEVTAAIEENLVPTYLQNLYLNNITRGEFCDLTIQAIEETLDQDIEDIVKAQTGKDLQTWISQYPFKDTTDSSAIAAYALGIVSGRGGGLFDPYATITRQEAAALLMRSAKVLGMDTSKVENAGFVDSDKVGVWFTDAVNFVYQINVMSGTGGNAFTPLGTYTREQSYVTIYRLFQAVMKLA